MKSFGFVTPLFFISILLVILWWTFCQSSAQACMPLAGGLSAGGLAILEECCSDKSKKNNSLVLRNFTSEIFFNYIFWNRPILLHPNDRFRLPSLWAHAGPVLITQSIVCSMSCRCNIQFLSVTVFRSPAIRISFFFSTTDYLLWTFTQIPPSGHPSWLLGSYIESLF